MKSADYPALRVSSAAASRKAQALYMRLVRSELLIVVAAAAVEP